MGTKKAPADAERRLMDYAHLAAYLSISPNGAKRLAADGEIRKVAIGNRVLFDKADVDLFIERTKRAS